MAKCDTELLSRTLQACGLTLRGQDILKNGSYVGSFLSGRLSLRDGSGVTPEEVKREYSRQAVKQAANKFGWKLKAKGSQLFEVSK